MDKTKAQAVISNLMMKLDGNLTDTELEALVMAGEALEDEWISVDEMLPPITNEEERTTDEALIRGISGYMDVAYYDYRHKEWAEVNQHFRNVTHWRPLPDGPEEMPC